MFAIAFKTRDNGKENIFQWDKIKQNKTKKKNLILLI